MLNFPVNTKSPRNQNERKELDVLEKLIKDMFQEKAKAEVEGIVPPIITPPMEWMGQYPIGQKVSEYAKLPYGRVSTIDDAGCGPLAVEYALRIIGLPVDFKEIVVECVDKGYRAYIYDENNNIVDGSGTEYALFDNLATKLDSLEQVIEYLQKGCPITVLIENRIYHYDDSRKGNHFVTMLGIDQWQNGIFMDGNLIVNKRNPLRALVYKPFKKMAPGFRGAWAWEKEKVQRYLK